MLLLTAILALIVTWSDGAHAFVSPIIRSVAVAESASLMCNHTSLLNDDVHRTPAQRCSMMEGTHYHRRSGALCMTSSSSQSDEPRTIHKVSIDLPLGIVLEEMDLSDPTCGVVIVGINEGNAAKHNAGIFSTIKSEGNEGGETNSEKCICIRDKIMSVNGIPCENSSFDDVIGLISSTESNDVVLELGRLQGSTVVNYYNGICISAMPGETYGFLAGKCDVDIQYQCRTGNCNTCVRWMEFPDKTRDISPDDEKVNLYKRTIFHCVGKVPRGYRWLHVLDPYGPSARVAED